MDGPPSTYFERYQRRTLVELAGRPGGFNLAHQPATAADRQGIVNITLSSSMFI